MSMVADKAIDQIGEAAGTIWRILNENGSMPVSKLVKQAAVPRDLALQAIGWLAREDKIDIEENGRQRLVSLR